MGMAYGHPDYPDSDRPREIPRFGLRGDGLPRHERAPWKPQLVALDVLGRLFADDLGFWPAARPLAGLAEGQRHERAWEFARRYGTGMRRGLMAAWLIQAAEFDDPDDAHRALVTSATARWQPIDRGPTSSEDTGYDGPITYAEDPQPETGRADTYLTRDAFFTRLREGATLIARRGAGRCFECNEPSEHRATACLDYCSIHNKTVTVSTRQQRNRAIERVFDMLLASASDDMILAPGYGVIPEAQRNRAYGKLERIAREAR